MKAKFLMSTAVLALALGTAAANAQTTTDQNRRDQTSSQDRNGNPVRVIDTKRPGDSSAQAPSTPSAGTPTTASGTRSATSPSLNSQATPPANTPAASTSQPSAAQSGPSAPSSRPSTAQSPTAPASVNPATSSTTNTNQPAATQSTQPAAQQPSTAAGAASAQPNAAQQNAPAANQAATNSTQAPVQLSASLQVEQKTRLTQAFTRVDMKPVNNVNFSLTVGTTVPRTVEFRPLPASVVAIIPQYRGYNYLVVRNEIVIIEPGTSRIVDIIERGGSSQARATATTERKVNLSKQQRDYIREYSTRRTTSTTTGSAPRTTTRRVVVGDEIPNTVEIETFPEEVYREVPTMRSYRYIRGERGIYLVDPQRRTVIEDLDD